MGRAENRRQARELQKGNHKVLAEVKEEVTRKAVNYALRSFGVLAALVLHDKFGFGTKRIDRFYEDWVEKVDALQKGYINIEDVRELLKDEIGTCLALEDLDEVGSIKND